MQGLAVALKKPLVGVSAFDALARAAARDQMHLPDLVSTAAWIDAWRGEVYAAVYEQGEPGGSPIVDHPEALLARLAGRQVLFTGDGAALYEPLIRSMLGSAAHLTQPVAPLLAGAVGALAVEDLERGHRPLPHAIRPLYVRRSDAELARSAARASSAGAARVKAPRP
jgi:tRNA threonylcarbamoyladenosine biosynthesis protein TsaB